jgi:hypothetical protein
VAQIEDAVASAVFERNVLLSQRIVAGDFESALEDLIRQFEDPPRSGDRQLPLSDRVKRIARALRSGFAGLPPNGFDFCTWLWDVAPLHEVRTPHVHEYGAAHGFQSGVIHLRKLAAMVLDLYTGKQPQLLDGLVPMLDSSVDWVDARNLILYGFLDRYTSRFEEEYAQLLAIAHEKKAWRKVLPLTVAARIIALDASCTSMALMLLPPAFEAAGDANVASALAHALRSAAMYGDHAALGAFLASQHEVTHPVIRALFCDMIRRQRAPFRFAFTDIAKMVLDEWIQSSPNEIRPALDAARTRLSARV